MYRVILYSTALFLCLQVEQLYYALFGVAQTVKPLTRALCRIQTALLLEEHDNSKLQQILSVCVRDTTLKCCWIL